MYMTVKQAAEKWGLSDRRVRILCAQGKIPGAFQEGRGWKIPVDAVKPADGRFKSTESLLDRIDRKKAELDHCRPLTEGEVTRLTEEFIVEYTYNSNAIEGNTLTLRETDLVLRGLTIDQKPLKDHMEAVGHKEAFEFVRELVQNHVPLSERVIQQIGLRQVELIRRRADGTPGAFGFRVNGKAVFCRGANWIPPDAMPGRMTEERLRRLIADLKEAGMNMVRVWGGGSYESAESYEDKDMLKGTLVELAEDGAPKEGGLLLENTLLMPSYMKNDEQKALFAGKKKDEKVVFCPAKAYNNSETEIAALLKIEKTQIADHSGDFSFEIKEISRYKLADFNQDLYDSVFEKGTVTTEADFRARVKELVAGQYAQDSDYKFLLDVRSAMEKKVGKLAFADNLLKRIMLINSKDKDEKAVDEHYDKNIQELTWHLIKEALVKQTEVKVGDEDLKSTARDMVKMQFAQYGMMGMEDDLLDRYAKEMLKKEDTVKNIVDKVAEVKVVEAVKAAVKVTEKEVSLDEFSKLFETK